MAIDLTVDVRDTHTTLVPTIIDQDGAAVNLTNASTVIFMFEHSNITVERTATVTDAVNGVCSYQMVVNTLKKGINTVKARIEWATGKHSYSVTLYNIEGIN